MFVLSYCVTFLCLKCHQKDFLKVSFWGRTVKHWFNLTESVFTRRWFVHQGTLAEWWWKEGSYCRGSPRRKRNQIWSPKLGSYHKTEPLLFPWKVQPWGAFYSSAEFGWWRINMASRSECSIIVAFCTGTDFIFMFKKIQAQLHILNPEWLL